MSFYDYEQSMALAKKGKFYTTVNGKSEKEINDSENVLGISFSKQVKDFYRKYGYLSFDGNEIFGIDPYDKSGILEGNSVAYALNDREQYGLSKYWIPFYNFGDGSLAYQDYENLNNENEPRIISAYYDGEKYVNEGQIAEDFGQFMMKVIEG
ncbi:SMI1/KNR4 family protein [Butyrivibrio sp. INlla14]|uniref:SMI1/KNR4 family protein n=1 Tax=Butyrivibrio sp. INlla14 TaxID=1520808 RepID=UPI0008765454|nr:SMI1/KNR4 family protein [Butyrivibrio sp. INlla14]SCY73354.1 SMI1-KNR4 cell-wall [Butyrivibrio sp. INlla14]